MSYYVSTLVEQTASYSCYLVKPNFTPRQAGAAQESAFDDQLTSTGAVGGKKEASIIDSISSEQKEALRSRLHNGQGTLTLQEWDDFLADLVDLGIISNDERMYSNGILKEVPAYAQSGGTGSGNSHPSKLELDAMWQGDPLKWLDDMDFYMLKAGLYANLECRNTSGISAQRAAYKKVAQIVQDILQ